MKPPTPKAGVISGLIGSPPEYVVWVLFCDEALDEPTPSREGTVVTALVGLEWLVVEAFLAESVVVLAVVPFASVAVTWVTVAVAVAVVVVAVASLFLAVVVVSGFSLLSRIAVISTSRSPNPTAGAANDSPQRKNRTKVENKDHRILPSLSQNKRRERMRISRDGGAVRIDYMNPTSLVRITNMHMHY